MKHFLLKFNHGVEIGAYYAYMGHYRKTGDKNILQIAQDELDHRFDLRMMLYDKFDEPSRVIDLIFTVIGKSVYWACQVSPKWALNFVARTLEVFAVFSYEKLITKYPEYRRELWAMAQKERQHEEYFK